MENTELNHQAESDAEELAFEAYTRQRDIEAPRDEEYEYQSYRGREAAQDGRHPIFFDGEEMHLGRAA